LRRASRPQLKRDPLGGFNVSRPTLDYLILDAIADDVESVANIREKVQESVLSPSDLVESLRRLTNDRLVEACVLEGTELEVVGEGVWPSSNLEDLWFRITGRGTLVHGNWTGEGAV